MAERKKISDLNYATDIAGEDQILIVDKSETQGENASASGTTSIVTFNALKEAILTGAIPSQYWNQTGNDIFFNTGNVGIGTDSPAQGVKLDVNGKIKATTANLAGLDFSTFSETAQNEFVGLLPDNLVSKFGAVIKSFTTGQTILALRGNDAKDAFRIVTKKYASSFSHTELDGHPYNHSALVVQSDGNVGIGTVSPGHQLHIKSDSETGEFKIEGTQPRIYLSENDQTDLNTLIRNNNSVFQIDTADDTNSFIANRFSINHTTGNVGIGTDDPEETLDVRGTIKTKNDSDDSEIKLVSSGNLPYINFKRGSSADWKINAKGNGSKQILTTSFGTSDLMTVQADGNVGIGTASPDYKLTVDGGNASINGWRSRVSCYHNNPNYSTEKTYILLAAYDKNTKISGEMWSGRNGDGQALRMYRMPIFVCSTAYPETPIDTEGPMYARMGAAMGSGASMFTVPALVRVTVPASKTGGADTDYVAIELRSGTAIHDSSINFTGTVLGHEHLFWNLIAESDLVSVGDIVSDYQVIGADMYQKGSNFGFGTDSPEGKLEIAHTGSWDNPSLHLRGAYPTIKFNDTSVDSDDWYIHVNNNNFNILVDRDASGHDNPIDLSSNAWENPHPLQLLGDENRGLLFSNEIITTGNLDDNSKTYTAGGGLSLSGTIFSHTDTSSQSSVNNSGRTVIQDITLDGYGHITGINSATLSDNNTTYTAGTGMSLSGTTFNCDIPEFGLNDQKMKDDKYLSFGDNVDYMIEHKSEDGNTYFSNDKTWNNTIFRQSSPTQFGTSVMYDTLHLAGGERSYVKLFEHGDERLRTSSTGVDITGHLKLSDDHDLRLGSGEDYRIFHTSDSNNTFFLNYKTNSHTYFQSRNTSGDRKTTLAIMGGASPYAVLYYNSFTRLYTTSSGVDITGRLMTDGVSTTDNNSIRFGSDDDYKIYHQSSSGNTYFLTDKTDGDVYFQSKGVKSSTDASSWYRNTLGLIGGNTPYVKLYYSSNERLRTTSSGVDITGHISLPDNDYIRFGTSNDYRIYHNDNGTTYHLTDKLDGEVRFMSKGVKSSTDASTTHRTTLGLIGGNTPYVQLYHSNSERLCTTSGGVTIKSDLSQGEDGIPTAEFKQDEIVFHKPLKFSGLSAVLNASPFYFLQDRHRMRSSDDNTGIGGILGQPNYEINSVNTISMAEELKTELIERFGSLPTTAIVEMYIDGGSTSTNNWSANADTSGFNELFISGDNEFKNYSSVIGRWIDQQSTVGGSGNSQLFVPLNFNASDNTINLYWKWTGSNYNTFWIDLVGFSR